MAYILQCIRLVSHTVESVKLIIYNYNSDTDNLSIPFYKEEHFFFFFVD